MWHVVITISGNPFITIITQRQYRKEIKVVIMRILRLPILNDLLSHHLASTLRQLCQQQEALINAASSRAAKSKAVSSTQERATCTLNGAKAEKSTSTACNSTGTTNVRN